LRRARRNTHKNLIRQNALPRPWQATHFNVQRTNFGTRTGCTRTQHCFPPDIDRIVRKAQIRNKDPVHQKDGRGAGAGSRHDPIE